MDGIRIPTLSAVFDLVRQAKADHVRFNIETKLTPTSGADTPDPETFAAAVAQAVRDAGLRRAWPCSPSIGARLRSCAASLRRSNASA